jgi:hypothetical protein
MVASFHFLDDLTTLLRSRWRIPQPICLPVNRSASIKDVLEAFGVPHTEIGRILCNGSTIDFSHLVSDHQEFIVEPVSVPWDLVATCPLRPPFRGERRFLVDGNVGRLARYLRMAGFDTLFDPTWSEADLLQIVQRDTRIILTRNQDLLKRKQIVYGRCIRASSPLEQLREIVALFAITSCKNRFIRCLQCNGLLQSVPKQTILSRLEPLTIRYFDEFKICGSCDKIYWHGSHTDRMTILLQQVGLHK